MNNNSCSIKLLPEEVWPVAAERASEINPANAPALQMLELAVPDAVMDPGHLAALTGKYWGSNGVRLTVQFLDNPAADLRSRILSHMNSWGTWANVNFRETAVDGQVRIARAEGREGGFWSFLGTDILQIEAGKPTMNLEGFTMSFPDSEFFRVVRHETGHTLGFPHEHKRSQIVNRIDRDKAIQFFATRFGWSEQMVISQVLTPLENSALIATEQADPHSIMCYWLPASIMRDGIAVEGGTDINDQDAEFASSIYPKPPAWYVSESGTGKWKEINVSRFRIEDLAFGDFTGNGKTDVFRADGTNWFISEGGTGKWKEINTSKSRIEDLAFGDFTGNGKTDVFRADGTNWFISEGGTGKWKEINTSKSRIEDLAFGDFTGDAKTDVFRADGTNWFISEGGTGKWKEINTSKSRIEDLAFGDFTGNGKTDVFRADGTNWFISEGGTGKWKEINTSKSRIEDLAFGDFTGDAKTDVFRADGTNWFISEGGTGKWKEINTSKYRVADLAFGDFTGDGTTDVFRAG
ncbi:FG-GAP-like repeat-containing protein [Nocardia abscessus]|uniref:FG-GAP-like repeat-containing protein n=2 Tax=Nocardia abscessus TaxID=120957 RepID=UPI001D1429D5|nr:FG-GAP-like repeat-containing protein [Nocardia abscessus]MCC3326163.1 hypothetical protein [Nocardia abscessus]